MPGSSGRPADWLFSGKATVEINTLNDTLIQGRTRPGLLKRWGCDPPSLPTSDPDYKQQPAKVYLKINRLNDTFISHLLRRPWWQRSPHRALETLDHRGCWLTHCLHTTEGQHWGWGLPLCSPHTGRGLDFESKTMLHHAADHIYPWSSLFYLMYPIIIPHPSYSSIDVQ